MFFFEFLLAISCFFLYNMLLKGKIQMNRNNETNTTDNNDITNSSIPNIEENTSENLNEGSNEGSNEDTNELEGEPIVLEIDNENDYRVLIDNLYNSLQKDVSKLIRWIVVNSFYYYSRVAEMIEYVYDKFRPSRDLLVVGEPKFYKLPDDIAQNPKINSKYWGVMPFSYDGVSYYRCLLTQNNEESGIFEMPEFYLNILKTFNRPLLTSNLGLNIDNDVVVTEHDIGDLTNMFIIPGNQILFCDALKYFWLKIILLNNNNNENQEIFDEYKDVIENTDKKSNLDNYDMTVNIIDLDLNEYTIKSGLIGVEIRSLTYEEI